MALFLIRKVECNRNDSHKPIPRGNTRMLTLESEHRLDKTKCRVLYLALGVGGPHAPSPPPCPMRKLIQFCTIHNSYTSTSWGCQSFPPWPAVPLPTLAQLFLALVSACRTGLPPAVPCPIPPRCRTDLLPAPSGAPRLLRSHGALFPILIVWPCLPAQI